MSNIIDCTFHSEWDGGFTISSNAKIDTSTGIIVNIEVNDSDFHVETLDREYITIDGSDAEIDVGMDEFSNDYVVEYMEELKEAIRSKAKPA